MVWEGDLSGGLPFKDDQEKILKYYFSRRPSRIVVSAGAGTGKTTLLVEIYAEAAIKLFSDNPNENPFDKILAVTFTVEATRQMKKKVRARLEKHFEVEDDEDSLIKMLQWLESESRIFTLDSLTRELLSDVSLEAGMNPLVTVPDEYEIAQVKEKIIGEILDDARCRDDFDLIARAFPDYEWRGDTGWRGLLDAAFNKSRQYGLTADDFRVNANKTLNDLYQNRGNTPDSNMINKILSTLGANSSLSITPERVKRSYQYNASILEAFCNILSRFEELYDLNTMDKGWVGHDDARFLLIQYMKGARGGNSKKWMDCQNKKYLHILVDEFQDTSYAQCMMIKNFIGPQTSVFIIGDPKQAIYQWRNADPQIFLDIIKNVPTDRELGLSGRVPHLEAEGFKLMELVSNFRSNDDLIRLYNDMFGEGEDSIFEDDTCTKRYPIPHSNLERRAYIPLDHKDDPHIHLITGKDEEAISDILQEVMHGSRTLYVREGEGENTIWRRATLGDCCILMQSRGLNNVRWENLRTELVMRGIRYVMLSEKGLFSRPEISLLIDILDWLGNPHKKDPLIRILRSPLVGLSDRSISYMAYHNFNINAAIDDKDKPEWFNDESGQLIQGLIDLREDLRWMREGKKSEMIEKILRYSHLDTTLLSYIEGELCLGNIRYFQEIVATWEEEELIEYQELIERLKYFREKGSDAYNMAVMADETDKTSVKIATVHSTKGLEFPIVFHYYTKLQLDLQISGNMRNDKLYDQKFGDFIILRQVARTGDNKRDWEDHFSPDTSVLECVQRTMNPLAYDGIIQEVYAEKWRLYYVAMTRAKDHIFHSMGKPNKGHMSWLHKFKDWVNKHPNDPSVEKIGPLTNPLENPGPMMEEPIKFDGRGFTEALQKAEYFTPKTLNPSHLYDLVYCPRYYQYSVLQNVKGGPNDQYGVPTDYDAVRFGKHVHKALELRDFSSTEPNPEYLQYIGLISKDKEEKERVEDAVQKLIDSEFFKKYEFGKRRLMKEYEIVYGLNGEGFNSTIYMDDHIDLLIEDPGKGVVLLDYKTNYPIKVNKGAEFLKKHYAYQLAAYKLAIEEGLGIPVTKVFLISYDPKKKIWVEQDTQINAIDIKKELSKIIPLKIVDGGLEKHEDEGFCKPYCEFEPICKPFGKPGK